MKTSEDALIQKFRRAQAGDARRQLQLGMGDDAALFITKRGYETILTCDWFLEGTHFLRDRHPADSIGWKCLARAVSDVAAMGGEPRCFLLSVALPESCIGKWLDEFLSGLRRAARRFGCALAGGDTTRRRDVLINVTAVGEVRAGRGVLRSGARPGDALFVTGRLGEAQRGLQLIRQAKGRLRKNHPLLKKHLYPEPRLALGQWLSEARLASAMMDLSDGLSSDLPRLCAASKVGAKIEAARIPTLAPERGGDPLELALNGGDDYELLFTVRRDKVGDVPRSFQGVPLAKIGTIIDGRSLQLMLPDGREETLVAGGWDPFRAT
jgi:thiamine-monophosphate kinase